MTTTAMNSVKVSLAQRILAIDNPDLLFKIKDQVDNLLGDGDTAHLPTISYKELRDSLERAAEDAKHGNVFACEDIHSSLEAKYPWLCE